MPKSGGPENLEEYRTNNNLVMILSEQMILEM